MAHKRRAIKAELARTLGISATALTKFQHDPTFPAFDEKNEAEVYAVCVWWYLRKEAQPVPSDPDMLAGTESDGLERYRLARAQQEEIKLAEQRQQIVRLNDFEEAGQAILGPYRRLAEHVKRMGNNDVWEMLEEANAEVLRGLDNAYAHADTAEFDTVDGIRENEPAGVG
jgi:phage terminase Nu1 subunit (DNA packaging protein)